MQITKKDLEKNQVELTIEVSNEELKPHLEKAAQALSVKHKIPGFRPGKAPFDLIKNKVGEMNIYQAALDSIITDTFYKAVTREKLQTVGQPQINVEKIAPGNPLIYKAVVALLPKVTLGNWQKIKVQKKDVKATDEDIKKTMDQLQNMNVKETIVDRASKKGDKIEIDFEVYRDKVIVEGGKNPKYPMILGQSQMIPGFEEQLIGLKANDKKEFELKFPDKYFQKSLAGKLATFKVKVLGVYERNVPKLDNELAKKMGFESVEALEKQLKENISRDKETKEKQRSESEAIKAIVKDSEIGDLPDSLIKTEVHKMVHEMEHNIARQGLDMAGYLKSINKTQEDLEKDFRPQAIERLKGALVLRQLVEEEKFKLDDKELDENLKKQEAMYKDNKEALKNIQHPAYRTQMANMLLNQKVIKLISDTVIK